MLLRLLYPHGSYRAGEIIERADPQGLDLIRAGLAVGAPPGATLTKINRPETTMILPAGETTDLPGPEF